MAQKFMKGNFKTLFKDSFIKYSLMVSILFVVINSLIVFISYGNLPSYIPFFKSMPWGEERLAHNLYALFFPLGSLLVIVINYLLISLIYKKYTLVSRILSANAFLFCVLALVSYLQVILLIF